MIMCGIVGYTGKDNAIPILLNGLKSLEYRGYDSSGIAYVIDNKIIIKKEKGKIRALEKILDNNCSNIGIGHTRWATHGIPSRENSHPHQSGKITLVHNGIIENYEILKKELLSYGYTFQSDTDSEVAACYINHIYNDEKDMLKTLDRCQKVFKGSYAFGIIEEDNSDKIYAMRKDSPLIIGLSAKGNFIASDMPAIIRYTNKYLLLEENDIAILTKDKVTIYNKLKEVKRSLHTFDYSLEDAEKNGYDHFMLKEIHEEPSVAGKLIKHYLDNDNLKKLPDLTKYDQIDIASCGSAYHAALVGKYLIEKYADIPVNVHIASEYRYEKKFLRQNNLLIAISQSGETADTLASIRLAKEYGSHTIGIVNVVGSSIAREVDEVIYTSAGPEIAVATTKAYLLQVLTLSLMAYKYSSKDYYQDYKSLEEYLQDLINMDYKSIAQKLYQEEHIFFIGRGIDYATAMEGSLKLKEISYIHSETYASGELKHGTISLISDNTWVIAIVTNEEIADKTINNIKEVKARGAKVLLLTTKDLLPSSSCYDELVLIPKTKELLMPLLTIIPLQLLAYEVAKLKGCDIDKPRNLAKSVTVE